MLRSISHSHSQRHFAPVNGFEALEQRRLMSASWFNGVLTVTGTNNPETITVEEVPVGFFLFTQVRENNLLTFSTPLVVNQVQVNALAGNDVVTIGPGVAAAQVRGGDGNDVLTGGDKDDLLLGEGDNDRLIGGDGADRFFGGLGTDTADYSARAMSLNIALDNNPNDGAAGEMDNVTTDMEVVFGGSGADVISSNPAQVLGRRFVGNAGMDHLIGGPGNDRLEGGAGNDILIGAAGRDLLDGGLGDDVLRGDSGIDTCLGGDGNDRFFGMDNEADLLIGGAGLDIFSADLIDTVIQ